MKKTQVSNDSSSELLSTTITLLIVGKYDGTSNNLASSFQEARKEMLKHGWSYIKFDSDAKILTLMTFLQENLHSLTRWQFQIQSCVFIHMVLLLEKW